MNKVSQNNAFRKEIKRNNKNILFCRYLRFTIYVHSLRLCDENYEISICFQNMEILLLEILEKNMSLRKQKQ